MAGFNYSINDLEDLHGFSGWTEWKPVFAILPVKLVDGSIRFLSMVARRQRRMNLLYEIRNEYEHMSLEECQLKNLMK